MYNARYLPENFEQCRLENALIQDGGKNMKRFIFPTTCVTMEL